MAVTMTEAQQRAEFERRMAEARDELELRLDLMLLGSCFWRVVDGVKVRIPPDEVMIEGYYGNQERGQWPSTSQ
jgi:hypothetical protein